MLFFNGIYAFINKGKHLKHTFIYRTTFKLHGDNVKDNYVISQ